MRAITLLHARLKRARVHGGLIACVHDELLLELHENDAGVAAAILERSVIEAFTQTFPGAPTAGLVAVKIGETWADLK
jgi:hypothetical protein